MNPMKNKLFFLLTAFPLFTISCTKEQAQHNCQCCGGYVNGCGTPYPLTGNDREKVRALCSEGSDIDAGVICDLN